MIQLKNNITDKTISHNVISYVMALRYLSTLETLSKEIVFEGLQGVSNGSKIAFLKQIHSLPVKEELLTTKEITTINMIGKFLENIAVKNKNCKDILPTSDNISVDFIQMSPDNDKFRFELRVLCPLGITCDLHKIACVINSNEYTTTRLGVRNGMVVYSYVFVSVLKIPVVPLTINCRFLNEKNQEIAKINKSYTF